ncbi:MAG: hypothetical protein LUC17_00115 [Oscillospiraceae bacterium]|nr:hypothetical protein [Oscillospiraceae bacterium]
MTDEKKLQRARDNWNEYMRRYRREHPEKMREYRINYLARMREKDSPDQSPES